MYRGLGTGQGLLAGSVVAVIILWVRSLGCCP